MTERKTIGFFDRDATLNCWGVQDCKSWSLWDGVLYGQRGEYVLHSAQDACIGGLARLIHPESAAELLLGAGHDLPRDLVALIRSRQPENPKIEKRSKPRKPPRVPKGQHGLAGFANSTRQRESRGPSG